MKNWLLLILLLLASFANISVYAKNTYKPKSPHTYILGPKGGCYYINRNGN